MSTNAIVPVPVAPLAPHDPAAVARPAGPPPWTAPLRRWPVTLVCCALAAAAAYGVAKAYGQNHWQVEGTLVHTPVPVAEELRGDYSPPSPQTLVSLAKSPAALEEVTRELQLPVSAQALDRCLRVNKPVNADAVSLVLEWPDPEAGCAIVNALMAHQAREAAALRREAAKARLNELRSEQAARRKAVEEMRAACPDLPPGVTAERVRTELELAAKDATTLTTELNTVREKLNAQKAAVDRLAAREKALASAAATGSPVGLEGDDVTAPYTQRKQLVQDALRDEENRIAELTVQRKSTEDDIARARAAVRSGGGYQYEVDRLAADLKVIDVKRANAEKAAEARRQELAALPLTYVQTEKREAEAARDEQAARAAALEKGLAEKRRETSRLADLAVAAAEVKALDARVAGLRRLAGDSVTELAPAHPATASSQPIASNRRSLGVLTFGGVLGLCLTGLIAGSWVTARRRCPAAAQTYGLPVLAQAAPVEGEPDAVAEARQLAVRLRTPVHQSGGMVLFAPAREDSQTAEIACQLARYLALWGDSVLILDARCDTPDAGLPPPLARPDGGRAATEDMAVVSLSPALTGVTDETRVVKGRKAARRGEPAPTTPDMKVPDPIVPGLFHLLRSGTADEAAMIRETALTGVHYLPVGSAAPDPDLFASAAMHRLLVRLSERFDRILVLGPPLTHALAAEVLAGYVDGVAVFVRRCDPTSADVARAVEAVRGSGAPWVGAVVTA